MPDSAEAPRILTIGHSNLLAESLVEQLAAQQVRGVADVRRFAASRRWPQFNAGALAATLDVAGMAYRHFPALGGRRPPRPDSPNTGWKNTGFRGYADYMQTAAFGAALAELEAWARERLTAIMCAEALYWRCHRRLLADALLARGWHVEHILGPAAPRPAEQTRFARIEAGGIVYPGSARLFPES